MISYLNDNHQWIILVESLLILFLAVYSLAQLGVYFESQRRIDELNYQNNKQEDTINWERKLLEAMRHDLSTKNEEIKILKDNLKTTDEISRLLDERLANVRAELEQSQGEVTKLTEALNHQTKLSRDRDAAQLAKCAEVTKVNEEIKKLREFETTINKIEEMITKLKYKPFDMKSIALPLPITHNEYFPGGAVSSRATS